MYRWGRDKSGICWDRAGLVGMGFAKELQPLQRPSGGHDVLFDDVEDIALVGWGEGFGVGVGKE